MKNKHIVKGLSALLTLILVLSGCQNGGAQKGKTKIPEFPKSEIGVVFGAYAAPTFNSQVTEELDDAYKKVAEAGFNKVLALYEGNSNAEGKDLYETIEKRSVAAQNSALIALDLCQKYGLKYWVRDWSFYGLGKNFSELKTKAQFEKIIAKMFDENNKYIDHPAYGGNFGFDEPHMPEIDGIAWQAELYNKYIQKNSKTGGEMYVNLNPSYVNEDSLGATYGEYVDYYFQKIAPHLGYVSWDFYPYKVSNSGDNYIREMYYYNLELMAQKCKEYNCELRCFVQAKGDFTGMRPLETIADLRFQIYSCMAFGAREMDYYTYSSSVDETNATADNGYSIYNYRKDCYTWEYEAAKQVNNEVHKMEDAYMAYDWAGILYRNANEMFDNQLFANLSAPLESHDRLKFVSCTQDVMAGVFTAKDQKSAVPDAFMIVNVTEPSEKLENEVTVRFNDATSLLMYRYGEQIVVDLGDNGEYTFKLQPGEGRFVIPLT